MSTTTSDTWEYIPLLDECIKILLTVGFGILLGHFQLLNNTTFLPQATKFVFNIALPLHIFKGIGIATDFYDDSFLWKFIFVFLILRAIALIFSFLAAARNGNIGQVAVMWLALTWISTIIMGIPIAAAVFDDPNKGQTYGILAGISSFIFQLPLQLVLFECHVIEKEYLLSNQRQLTESSLLQAEIKTPKKMEVDPEQALTVTQPEECAPITRVTLDENLDIPSTEPKECIISDSDANANADAVTKKDTEISTKSSSVVLTSDDNQGDDNADTNRISLSLWMQWVCTWSVWKKILGQLMRNTVLWGILMGFIFSLSTVGPRFLNPKSDDFVPGLGWIFATAGWLGDCVSPVALIAMGVWMDAQGRKLIRIQLFSACCYMVSKLILVPLLALGLSKAMRLNNEAGRAAVLIAALPISMASFSLADRYEIGQAVLSENVALGTALILPTIILWNLVLDALDIYPIA